MKWFGSKVGALFRPVTGIMGGRRGGWRGWRPGRWGWECFGNWPKQKEIDGIRLNQGRQNVKRREDVEEVHWCPWNRCCKLANSQCPHCQEISEARKQLESDWEADETGTVQELSLMSGTMGMRWVHEAVSCEWCACILAFFQEWEEDLDQPRTVEHLVSAPFHCFCVSRFLRFGRCEPLRLMRMKGDSWIPLAPQLQECPSRWKKSNEILNGYLNTCINEMPWSHCNGAKILKCKPAVKFFSKFLNCEKEALCPFQFLPTHVFCESLLGFPRDTPKDFQEDLDQLPGQFLNSCLWDASGSFKLRMDSLDETMIGFDWKVSHAKALWPGSSAGSHHHQAGTCCEWQEPSRWRQTLLDCRHLWFKDPISVDTPGLPSPRHRRHQPCPGRSLLNGKARKVFSHKFCHQGVPRAPAIQWSLLIFFNLNRWLRWIWTKPL